MAGNLKAIFFDCDNTLVLSEKMAFGVCASIINQIFKEKGISKSYNTEELMEEFVGRNFGGMLHDLNIAHSLGISEEDMKMYTAMEIEQIIQKIETDLDPTPGAYDKVKQIYESKSYKIAVVSSSAKPRLVASMKRTKLCDFFPDSMLFSAATSMDKPTTKPDPAIYLFAAKKLGVHPSECLAIEDSVSGVKSAVNAKIKTIGYVGAYHSAELMKKASALLSDAGAYIIINSWEELDDAISKS